MPTMTDVWTEDILYDVHHDDLREFSRNEVYEVASICGYFLS